MYTEILSGLSVRDTDIDFFSKRFMKGLIQLSYNCQCMTKSDSLGRILLYSLKNNAGKQRSSLFQIVKYSNLGSGSAVQPF